MALAAEELPERSAPENPAQIVWALAWPAVALNSLQVVNTLLDRAFLGHLPASALIAHGASLNVMFLAFSLAVSVATGVTAIVARAYGAGNETEVRDASRQGLGVAWTSGLLIAGLALAGSHWFAGWLLPSSEVAAKREMASFLTAYALGLPAIYIIQSLAGALRGVGDTKSPMWISGFQIVLHIVLNPLLIFPPHPFAGVTIPGLGMGLTGAAASLSISAWVAALVYLVYSVKTPLGELWRLRLPQFDWFVRIIRIAVPAGVMSILRVLSLTAMTLLLGLLPNGGTAMAAMSVAFAIESIMFMPAFGLSVAAGALVGQSLGMREPGRAERLGWTAAHHACFVTLALVTPIFVFAPQIAGLLLGDKVEMIAQTSALLRWLCLTEFLFAYSMVLIGAMQGAGDTTRPLWISVFSLWILRVPLTVLVALPAGAVLAPWLPPLPFGMGMASEGAWIAMSVSQAVQGLISILVFRAGGWKAQTV